MKHIEEEIEQFKQNVNQIDLLSKDIHTNNERFQQLIDEVETLKQLKQKVEATIENLAQNQEHYAQETHKSMKEQSVVVLEKFNTIERDYNDIISRFHQLVEQSNTTRDLVKSNQDTIRVKMVEFEQASLKQFNELKQTLEIQNTTLEHHVVDLKAEMLVQKQTTQAQLDVLKKLCFGLIVINIIAIIIALVY